MSAADGGNGSSADDPDLPDTSDEPAAADESVSGDASEASAPDPPSGPGPEAEAEAGGESADDPLAQRDEYLEALQRVKAEFANYRKRVEKERDQMSDRAAGRLAEDLLPVLDACDSGIAHGDAGAEAIRSQLFDVLGRAGLEPVEAVGKPFDPQVHEAVLREEGDDGAETVIEIMRAGYTWRGRILRPAMVKVGG